MDIQKRKLKGYIALSVLIIMCLIMASAMTFFLPNKNAEAYTSANLPSSIGQIYNAEYNIFDKYNLDVLATKGGFTDFDDMVSKATSGTTKTATDFGNTTLDFGVFGNNVSKNLTWMPVYLSKTTTGEAILTLWLASTESSNTSSQQEIAPYATSYNTNSSVQPYCNMYATSYVRAKVLNNSGLYYTNYGNNGAAGSPTSVSYTATSNGSNKYEQLTTGNLAQYLATPSQVAWQANANYQANDLAFTGYTHSQYKNWQNDKLWLPSLYETYTSNLTANSTATTFTDNGGLWKLSTTQRSNNYYMYLRSGKYNNNGIYSTLDNYILGANGGNSNAGYNYETVVTSCGIRPALHLNLTKVAETDAFPIPSYKTTEYKTYGDASDVTFYLEKIKSDYVKKVELTSVKLGSDYKTLQTPVTTEITPTYANGGLSFKVQDVGKYTLKITLKDGLSWMDGSTSKEFDYTLKYKVSEPKFSENSATSIEKTYDKSEKSLALTCNKDLIDVKIKDEDAENLKFDTDTSTFKVTNAKTSYVVSVELKNKELMEWTTVGDIQDKSLEITIKKMQVAKPKLSDNPPSKPYTGSPVNFPMSNYTAGGDVELKGPSPSTNVVSSITQTNAGTYVYTISLKDKNNTEWVGGGTADDTLTVYITSSGIAKPSLSNSAALLTQEKTYSTTTTPKGATFTIYNTAGVSITPTDTTQTDAVLSGNTITVTKVGTYTFRVELADSTNTKWDDNTSGTYDLTVKVKPKEVTKPTLATTESSSKPYTGNSITFNLTGMSADVELKDPSSATVSAITQTNAGTYDYSASLVDPINTTWVGGGTTAVPLPVTITRKNIAIPAFATGADRKTYDGSKQPFSLPTLDST
ncbi:MAG: hypothetical protein K2J13_03810, partial [Clostridia bacterium]|nr:hypothetical protein [Clostridia bacterium]